MNYSTSNERMRWKLRVAFAVATAVFFLLCHGLMGASHVAGLPAPSVGDPVGGSHAVHQTSEDGSHGATSDHGVVAPSHGGHAHGGHGFAYAAVLVAGLFLLAFALPMLRLVFALVRDAAARGREATFYRIAVPCRGPTLPALQVFRL